MLEQRSLGATEPPICRSTAAGGRQPAKASVLGMMCVVFSSSAGRQGHSRAVLARGCCRADITLWWLTVSLQLDCMPGLPQSGLLHLRLTPAIAAAAHAEVWPEIPSCQACNLTQAQHSTSEAAPWPFCP